MAAGDTYELAIKATCNSQSIVNLHHFRAEAAGSLASSIASDWNTNLKAAWLALLPPPYTLALLSCRQINPPGPVAVDFTPTGTLTGGVGTVAGGLTVAQVIKWTSAYIGRSRRGRTYVGPMAIERVSGGNCIAGQVTNGLAYVTAMLAQYGSGGGFAATARLVIWSRTIALAHSQLTPPSMGDPLSASAYVTAGTTAAPARSQRRRELGVGS